MEKSDRFEEIAYALKNAGLITDDGYQQAKSIISQTRIKDLIEFSRAVHAEMEAIISVGRNANKGLVGSTLYCTTFPCHNCARHIVASGIMRVVYIEPYAKSLATKLHDDSLAAAETPEKHVVYQQYQGVAPRNVDRFFGVRGERKRGGKLLETSPRKAVPIGLAPLDGIAIRETLVIREAASNEARLGANVDGQVQGSQTART
jgi:deoxycytidylate deaminase